MSTAAPAHAKPPGVARKWIRGILSMLVFLATIFAGAGRLDWDRGWICVATFLACMAVNGLILRVKNPALMRVRMAGPGQGTKPFDRVFLRIFIPLIFVQPLIASLDGGRFHWSHVPYSAVWPGVVLFAAATAIMCWVMAVNPHAEMSVRIQTERGHKVVSTGPYRFVRHPMYVGMMLTYVALNLILGSLWAFVVVAFIVALVVWRTALEDRTLLDELPGYREYAAHTRWRLIPGLW